MSTLTTPGLIHFDDAISEGESVELALDVAVKEGYAEKYATIVDYLRDAGITASATLFTTIMHGEKPFISIFDVTFHHPAGREVNARGALSNFKGPDKLTIVSAFAMLIQDAYDWTRGLNDVSALHRKPIENYERKAANTTSLYKFVADDEIYSPLVMSWGLKVDIRDFAVGDEITLATVSHVRDKDDNPRGTGFLDYVNEAGITGKAVYKGITGLGDYSETYHFHSFDVVLTNAAGRLLEFTNDFYSKNEMFGVLDIMDYVFSFSHHVPEGAGETLAHSAAKSRQLGCRETREFIGGDDASYLELYKLG
jgi:hypothetical protein